MSARTSRPRPGRSAPDAGAHSARDHREERPEARVRPAGIAIVGIHTRGAVLARRLHAIVGELSGDDVPLGDIDISFYRDDALGRAPTDAPVVHASHLDFDLAGRTIVLVDDVLFTGRTVRAAIDALFDYGRPRAGPARGPRRPRPPRASDPPRLHRQEPADRPRRAGLRPPRGDRRGRRGGDRRRARRRRANGQGGIAMRHLLSIEDLDRADIERICDRAPQLRRGRPPRHQEGADAARPDRSSTSSTSRAPGRAPRSSWPPSASPPTSSRSSRPAPRSTRASRCRTRSRPSPPTSPRRS